MSIARVDQIVNQLGTGSVEFPQGLTVPAGKTLSVGGPVSLYQGLTGTAGQIIKAGVSSELVWSDPDSVSISAQDGASADRKVLKISTTGTTNTTQVVLRAGNNVTLTRATDEIRIDSSYVNDDTITRIQASGGTLVSGDVVFTASGASSVSQVGQTITYSSSNTTYTAGTGISLTGTQFSIPQEIETTSSPTFAALTLTGNIGAVDGNFSGDVTGTWAGGVISIANGGTGQTTASSAFLSLAPAVSSQNDRFLKTDGSTVFWSDLPAAGGFTPKTYTLTGQDGGTVNTSKLRLADNDGNYTDVVLAASGDITIARSGNTITIGENITDTDTNDYVTNGSLTGTDLVLTRSGELADITVDLSTLNSGAADGNTTYDLTSGTTSTGAKLNLVPGGTGAGDPTDVIDLVEGSNMTITRNGNGSITFDSTDTDTNTITQLQITGPNTTGGALASGDISLQASGAITMVQSGTTIAIASTDTNSYVSDGYYNATTGKLFLERTDSLADVEVPVTNLETYFNTKYATQSGLTDAKISGAAWDTTTGVLTLTPNDGTANITVSLDGRYVTSQGPDTYATSAIWQTASQTQPGEHAGRKVLVFTRNDSSTYTVESEPLLDYLDTLYAPVTQGDTRVDAFTWSNGQLYLSVSNGDEYTHDLDGRYVLVNDYPDNLLFNTSNGVLTMEFNNTTPGTAAHKADVTVDLDGRYKLATDTDVQISSLEWNSTTGNLKANKNNSTATALESLDGRYFDSFSVTGNTVTMIRTGGNNSTFDFPVTQTYIAEGTKMLFYQAAAPCGWVRDTNVSGNSAVRIVPTNTNGGGSGGSQDFTTVFQNQSTGGSVTKGNLDASPGNGWQTDWGSTTINHNFSINGNVTAGFDSAASINGSININGHPNINNNLSVSSGNLSVSGINANAQPLSINQVSQHWHNYYRPGSYGNADWDDGTVVRGEQSHTTDGAGGNGSHSHYVSGGSMSGSPSLNGSVGANRGSLGAGHNLGVSGNVTVSAGNLALNGNVVLGGNPGIGTGNINVNGNPTFTAGSINMAVKYVDVIVCTKDQTNGAVCP